MNTQKQKKLYVYAHTYVYKTATFKLENNLLGKNNQIKNKQKSPVGR